MAGTKSEATSEGRKLQETLDLYFAACDKSGKKPTMKGLVKFAKLETDTRSGRTVESVEKTITKYFLNCEESGDVPSEHSLCRALGVNLATLRRWHDGETSVELQEPIQDAYAQMTSIYMQMLLTGNKNMTPFVIFMLKQPRFAGYQDRVESKQDIAVNVKMGKNVDESDFK